MTTSKSKTAAAAARRAPKAAEGREAAQVPAAAGIGAGSRRESAAPVQGYDDVVAFNQATLAALLASGAIVAKGVGDLAKAWLDFTQSSVKDGAAAAQAIVEAKTLPEAVARQNDYAHASFDKLIAEGGKLSAISVKLTDEALRPIRTRFEVAVERMLKPAA